MENKNYSSNPIAERYVAPLAVALGVLLIIGGIILGIRRNDDVAQLPEYSPVISSAAPNATPSVQASTTPTGSPTGEVKIVELPSTSSNTKGGVNYAPTSAAKKQAQQPAYKAAVAPKQSQSLPEYKAESSLPDYQPNSNLPAYQPTTVATPEKQTVTVALKSPGRSYNVEVMPGSTVQQVMQAARSAGFIYETKQFDFGVLVTSINGQSQTNTQYWKYEINGVFASKGISEQTINAGDTIVWTLS